MKVIVTYKSYKTEDIADMIAQTGSIDVPNKDFGLRAVDFGDGWLDMATDDFEKNQEKILKFWGEQKKHIVARIKLQNIMDLYEDDNVIMIDDEEELIHVGYIDEFLKK